MSISTRCWSLVFLLLIAVLDARFKWTSVALGQVDESDLGQLSGHLVSSEGERVNAGKAAVFLCDAASGLPIHRTNKRPIRPTLGDPQIGDLWVAETDDQGGFEFPGVLAGKYRLVAQSWSGAAGFKGFDANAEPSAFVFLHGVCENVEVKAGETAFASIRQLGDHTLRITNDPQEEHAILLISLKPTLGDGILGPMGWGDEFRRNLIGVTQMEVPFVTISGLPEDRAVHVGLMNYDNNPGFGAASFEAGQKKGILRIVASWSNGHQDPPAELAELVEHLKSNQITADRFCADNDMALAEGGQDALRVMFGALVENNEAMVKVRGRGDERLADVIAAFAYIQLQKSVR